MSYQKYELSLSKQQINKLKKNIEHIPVDPVNIRLTYKQLNSDKNTSVVYLTKTQLNNIKKRVSNKSGLQLKFSPTQLKYHRTQYQKQGDQLSGGALGALGLALAPAVANIGYDLLKKITGSGTMLPGGGSQLPGAGTQLPGAGTLLPHESGGGTLQPYQGSGNVDINNDGFDDMELSKFLKKHGLTATIHLKKKED